jgi:hypothetical protein
MSWRATARWVRGPTPETGLADSPGGRTAVEHWLGTVGTGKGDPKDRERGAGRPDAERASYRSDGLCGSGVQALAGASALGGPRKCAHRRELQAPGSSPCGSGAKVGTPTCDTIGAAARESLLSGGVGGTGCAALLAAGSGPQQHVFGRALVLREEESPSW